MIAALARDALRQALRGHAFWLLALVGLMIGLFVRATRATGADQLKSAHLRGAALDTWIGSVFLAALLFAVVAGLHLATEDRESGFLEQVAVRPVSRLRYACGRLLGLFLALFSGLLIVSLVSAATSGMEREDLPEIRQRLRPEVRRVDGAALADGETLRLAPGQVARFEFGPDARPEAELLLRPSMVKLVPGEGGFSGRVRFAVAYVPSAGARVEQEPVELRPLKSVPIRFAAPEGVPFAIEIHLLGEGYVLEVGEDQFVVLGPRVSFASQIAAAWTLLLMAQLMAGVLAFFFATGLSLAPASLAAGFLLIVGLSREAVLDIVAGIGRPPPGVEDVPEDGRFVRAFLTLLLRTVPDLARFNPSDLLGAAEALRVSAVAHLVMIALLWSIGCGWLVALVVPLRARE